MTLTPAPAVLDARTNRTVVRQLAFNVAERMPPPTWLVMRQIEIESGFDVSARSATGCLGPCQINPTSALKPGYGIPPCEDVLDPSQATAFLCSFLVAARRVHGGWGKALLAYNVGIEGDLSTASKPYRELAGYVALVFKETL